MRRREKITLTVLFIILFVLILTLMTEIDNQRKLIIANTMKYDKIHTQIADQLKQTKVDLNTLQNKVLALENNDSKLLKELKESIHKQQTEPITPAYAEEQFNIELPEQQSVIQHVVTQATVVGAIILQTFKLGILGGI